MHVQASLGQQSQKQAQQFEEVDLENHVWWVNFEFVELDFKFVDFKHEFANVIFVFVNIKITFYTWTGVLKDDEVEIQACWYWFQSSSIPKFVFDKLENRIRQNYGTCAEQSSPPPEKTTRQSNEGQRGMCSNGFVMYTGVY